MNCSRTSYIECFYTGQTWTRCLVPGRSTVCRCGGSQYVGRSDLGVDRQAGAQKWLTLRWVWKQFDCEQKTWMSGICTTRVSFKLLKLTTLKSHRFNANRYWGQPRTAKLTGSLVEKRSASLTFICCWTWHFDWSILPNLVRSMGVRALPAWDRKVPRRSWNLWRTDAQRRRWILPQLLHVNGDNGLYIGDGHQPT